MRVLLDTHLLLWSLASPAKLPPRAKRYIEDAEVFVSAASMWEISIKCGLGKLDADPDAILTAVPQAGFAWLPVSGAHAAGIVKLPLHHKDPFDRMLIAQAISEPMILLTNDSTLRQYGELVVTV